MTTRPLNVLLVEDNPDDVELILHELRRAGYEPEYERVDTDRLMRLALLRESWDIVLCDYTMPQFSAPAALGLLRDSRRDVPFIIISGNIGEETAVEAMRSGADDYLMKDNLKRLVPAMERALREAEGRRAHRAAEAALKKRDMILAAIGSVADDLLSPAPWENVVPKVLRLIGESTGASRVALFELWLTADGDGRGKLRFEWCDAEVAPRLLNPTLRDFPIKANGLEPWISAAMRGQPVTSSVEEATELQRRFLDEAEVRSFSCFPIAVGDTFWGLLSLSDAVSSRQWSPGEVNALNAVADTLGAAMQRSQLFEALRHSHEELELSYDATLEGWSRALDLRDRDTEGHSQRVTRMTVRLARSMGIDNDQLVHMRRGALLHDIGKLGVPDSILHKPGPLTEAEWVVMQLHPVYAYEFLSGIPFLRGAIDIPYCHHERWDGTGYPRGIAGEEIPLAARIFTVVDVWDALSNDRPYRAAQSPEEVRRMILADSRTHFDPAIVDAFDHLDPWRLGHGVERGTAP